MSCNSPLHAYYSICDFNISGKKHLHFIPKDKYDSFLQANGALIGSDIELVDIPCGKCIECRISKAQDWATRLELESYSYPAEQSLFVTLTYDDAHLPEPQESLRRDTFERGFYAPLVYKDIQKFHYKLRSYFNESFRFFGCGEYGPVNFRPHWHFLYFGLNVFGIFDDIQTKFRKNGRLYFESKKLNALWNKGFVIFTDFSPSNANYTAQYCIKKLKGDREKEYQDACQKLELKPLPAELIRMSNRPGIGSNFYDKHSVEVLYSDSINLRNGKSSCIPDYFKARLLNDYPEQYPEEKLNKQIRAAYKQLERNKRSTLSFDEIQGIRERAKKRYIQQKTRQDL